MISITWSRREGSWLFNNKYFMEPFDQLFAEAKKKNITICASAGDKGSIEEQVGGPDTWFPSSHPLVLGCGGTKLPCEADPIQVETVWNEQYRGPGPFHKYYFTTGGGFSDKYLRPKWQDQLLKKWSEYYDTNARDKRGVPDVSGHASNNDGYLIHFGPIPFYWAGGTSCSTPLWSALIAIINEKLGKNVGFFNPYLYKIGNSAYYSKAFFDITLGNNSLSHTIGYRAERNWDPCTGLGSPNGKGLLKALQTLKNLKRTQL